MEYFIYKDGCGIHVSRCLKEKLAWALDKWFQFTIFYYTYTTRDLQRRYTAIQKLRSTQVVR